MNLCIPIIIPEEGNWYCKICLFKDTYSGRKIVRKCSKSCANLGQQIDDIACKACKGTVKIKVYSCQIHNQCTLGKDLEGVACCSKCGDYNPK